MGLRNSITAALRTPYIQRSGQGVAADLPSWDYARDNSTPVIWRNAADTADIHGLNVDSDGVLLLGNSGVNPTQHTFTFNLSTNASLGSQQFFIVPYACRITAIQEIHAVAGNDAAAVTAYVEKLTSTQAVAAGTALHTALSMKATANTLATAVLSTSNPKADGTSSDLDLAAGDRLSVVFAGTLTTLSGLVFRISVTPGFKMETARFQMNANGDLADQAFFIANRPCIVTGAYWVHGTLGTNGSAVNVQLTKDTSTNAPGAGTDLLTNNTNAGFDCKGAINTVQTGTLSATAANLRLAAGDRLSVDFSGTLTALAGCVLVVTLQVMYTERHISFGLQLNANLVDQAFFIADRDYEILAVREVHSTAGSDGGSVNMQITIDSSTNAPGAGVDTSTLNSSAGFNMKGTANTVQISTFVDRGSLILMAGDRLSVDFAGTLTALVGVLVTVSLRPC